MNVVTSEKFIPDWNIIIYMAAIHSVALLALLPGNFSWGGFWIAFFSLLGDCWTWDYFGISSARNPS